MSLDTLLEAAHYIELQEQQQLRTRSETPVNSLTSTSTEITSQTSHPPSLPPEQSASVSGSIVSPVIPQFIIKDIRSLTVPQPRPTPAPQPPQSNRVIHNSFDMINPLVRDKITGEQKRKQPPMVFRSGIREVHNKLEKHRRAHLKECFDLLKKQLPGTAEEKKTSNLSTLHAALKYIQLLKRRERELEHEMERLAREKISAQQRLATLKKEIASQFDGLDLSRLLPELPTSVTPQSLTPSLDSSLISTDATQSHQQENGERIPIPPLHRQQNVQLVNGTKETQQQPVQTTTLSVLPVGYPVNQGLVFQKVALVPKSITELSPLVSSPAVAHFITAPQQLNGKVVPLVNVNAQYVVKPVVVVSTASRTS